MKKDDFKYLSQEYDANALDLVKQKWFYPYVYMSDFERFKEDFLSKEKFYNSLTDKKKLVIKNMNMFLRFGINLKWNQWKITTTCT